MARHKKKSTRATGRRALTAFVGLGVVAAGVPAAMQATAAPLDESAAAARTPIKVVQHNTDQKRGSFQKLVQRGGQNDLLLAEEVCETWVQKVKKDHPEWTVSFHKQKVTEKPTPKTPEAHLCEGKSKWKGVVAIHTGPGKASKQEFSFYAEGESPDPDQNFGMACVKFTKGGTDVHGCATHLQIYGDEDFAHRAHQTGRIKQITHPWIAKKKKKHSVIVGGDFNAVPNSVPLSNMYGPNGSGDFVEAHQLRTGNAARVGQPTAVGKDRDPRKIDYVFFSSNLSPLNSGGSLTVSPVTTSADGHAVLAATGHIG
ncbi:endonuclease/exonuclease/phosphatase family protein [Knoellia sp. S7-12]|uniref:endonuclease/exonuclease/phosphatase family protein n=1 Tax=Knoellia sp. S7-12 TaxID=3126698 RepID=UPI003366C272